MGCTFCTQIGEQPTLQETVESIRNLLQSGKEVDSEVFMGIASLALLGAFNAQGNKPIPIQ